VPRNLVCSVPESLDWNVASTVALGAIALQGVRRASPTLGETFVVVGLGALGQIAAQLLKANGCRVVGTDVNPARVALATRLGLNAAFDPTDGDATVRVVRLSRDVGADGVIITASGPSSEIVSTAFRMCRRKGRVVVIGDVGLELRRQDMYEKELDLLMSTSYGPGRYDSEYELDGATYPVAYVRWTETRNMQEFIDLAAEGRIDVATLIGTQVPLESAASAYETLERPDAPVVAVLEYRGAANLPGLVARRVGNPRVRPSSGPRVKLAVVGPGGFTRAVHLPNVASCADRYELRAIVGRSAPRALAVSRQFGAHYASTDFQEVLDDAAIDAVLISTRHHLHAGMALRALRAGKHVLLEKPLALTFDELNEIRAFYDGEEAMEGKPILLTGFNRRFSPYARNAKELVGARTSPMLITYRMNAGYIARDNWVHGPEGGGRNLGEACHVYDLFTFLTDSRVVDIGARAVAPSSGDWSRADNFVAEMTFEDGSVGVLTYTSLGHPDFPKERMELFVDGKVVVIDDYRMLTVSGRRGRNLATRHADKGHEAELREFAEGITRGTWPIPLWQQLQATEIALRVQARFTAPREPAN
jgi:predicted dehydrogenase/NADPH:quinone reductase-like Zn-dependent oxidoreductase